MRRPQRLSSPSRGPWRAAALTFVLAAVHCGSAADADYTNRTICPNTCNGNGFCGGAGEDGCTCFQGYTGSDCSLRLCPTGPAWFGFPDADGAVHHLVECSNRGVCTTSTGKCTCQTGFAGLACERLLCPLTTLGSGAIRYCSGHGRCVTMGEAASRRDDVNFFREGSYSGWDADYVMGCQCDAGFYGYDCSLQQCPLGDDPLTTGQVDEVQSITCTCPSACTGNVILAMEESRTGWIAASADASTVETALEAVPTIDGVTLSMNDSALCTTGGTLTQVTFTHQPGDLPLLRLLASSLASDTTLTFAEVTNGTRERVPCSNRGTCDTSSGICTCQNGTLGSDGAGGQGDRADCGYDDGIANCPYSGGLECSGKGSCGGSPSYQCSCNTGYTGPACEQQSCSTATAWFDEADSTGSAHAAATCSARGTCSTATGTCVCQSGFAGTSCQNMSCPTSGGSTCAGNGKCYTLAEAGLKRTVNGMNTPVTYTDWDADMIRGCYCDASGWHGPYNGDYHNFTNYRCSQRTCPVGDDPMELGKVDEVQQATCTATAGKFRVAFREASTRRLDYNATRIDLFYALRNTSTVGRDFLPANITVSTSSSDDVLCNSTGVVWTITFREIFGDLPELVPDTLKLTGSIAVSTVVNGTKGNFECSKKGVCNRETGRCKCFKEWGTSDGYGNPGLRGDCGARVLPWASISPDNLPGGGFT